MEETQINNQPQNEAVEPPEIPTATGAVVNEISRKILNQITRGELLTKTLELFEKNGEKIKISSPNFEPTMRQVLIEKYDIKYDTLIPSS